MIKILYEDSDIIVCHKPATLATQTRKVGEKDMVSELKNYLHGGSGQEPYVGLIHRLDQGVEGILVFAKNQKAAAGLSKQITEHTMGKFYYAVVTGTLEKRQDALEDYLIKDFQRNQSSVVEQNSQGTKIARLNYECLRSDESFKQHLLRIELITGRHHQIRAQLSHRGLPLINDFKYGYQGDRLGDGSIALCAYRLCLIHPVTRKQLCYEIKPVSSIITRMME